MEEMSIKSRPIRKTFSSALPDMCCLIAWPDAKGNFRKIVKAVLFQAIAKITRAYQPRGLFKQFFPLLQLKDVAMISTCRSVEEMWDHHHQVQVCFEDFPLWHHAAS